MKRPEVLHALCRLTWIIKGGDGHSIDSTTSLTAPALATILDVDLEGACPRSETNE